MSSYREIEARVLARFHPGEAALPRVPVAIGRACEALLQNPYLPGDWYGEQIAVEAARLLREKIV